MDVTWKYCWCEYLFNSFICLFFLIDVKFFGSKSILEIQHVFFFLFLLCLNKACLLWHLWLLSFKQWNTGQRFVFQPFWELLLIMKLIISTYINMITDTYIVSVILLILLWESQVGWNRKNNNPAHKLKYIKIREYPDHIHLTVYECEQIQLQLQEERFLSATLLVLISPLTVSVSLHACQTCLIKERADLNHGDRGSWRQTRAASSSTWHVCGLWEEARVQTPLNPPSRPPRPQCQSSVSFIFVILSLTAFFLCRRRCVLPTPSSKDSVWISCVFACSTLNWWTSDECNMINGTNGASFHPVISKNEMLYMFSSDLCRCAIEHSQSLDTAVIYAYFFTVIHRCTKTLSDSPSHLFFVINWGSLVL